MLLRQFYHEGLAQSSYLIGCQKYGQAIVVDPNRLTDQYLAAAQNAGLRIVAVAETHIHADFVSGARELAQQAGARLYLPDAGPLEYRYAAAYLAEARPLHDGETITVGLVRISAFATPGHTPEHMSLLVTDGAAADLPMAVLSGDCLFVGDVGRPDLLERSVGVAQTSTSLARQLYRSLERLRGLPEFVQVLPGHGAGSACGKSLGAVPQSVIGYELRFNPAFGMRDEIRFVRDILAGQPDPPPYFARMKRLNQMGPPPSPGVPQRRSAGELPEALHSGLRILDTRPADVYAAGHLTGSINIPFDQAFLTWAGWLIDGEEPLGLIAPADQIDACCRELALIGIDHLSGAWDAAVLERMPVAGCALASISRRQAAELYELVVSGQATVIDVRRHAERAEGKIAGSLGIPLANLAAAAADLPAGPLIVHCQGGVRSPIAASMLTAAGHRTVIDMVDGYSGWEQVMRRRRA